MISRDHSRGVWREDETTATASGASFCSSGLSYQFTVIIRRGGNKGVGVHALIAGGIGDTYTPIHFVSGHLLLCCS